LGKQNSLTFSPRDLTDDPITRMSVLGNFYGVTQPAPRAEALIAAHVPREHITDVADVYATRWWDYRRLAPGHAFYLFAHHYYTGARHAARKFVKEVATSPAFQHDRSRAFAIVGSSLSNASSEDVWQKDQAEITGLWKAMLIADAFGIPYPEFVKLSCRIALQRMWTHLPRPAHLYSESLAPHVIDEWEALKKERFMSSSHPIYAEENYVGLDLQDEYRGWLIEHIKGLKSDKLSALMIAIYDKRQLPEQMALQHFPAQLITRARLLHS